MVPNVFRGLGAHIRKQLTTVTNVNVSHKKNTIQNQNLLRWYPQLYEKL